MRTLFDRFHFCDQAIKVVGVGSVGTCCMVMLFMAEENDPLFLQVKEARASVLEPYAGKSLHANHGERVIAGQRLMQSASDMFLGWTEGADGRHYYVRQLRDLKMSAVIEDWDFGMLRQYARMCAQALARAHARSGDAALISGYAGYEQDAGRRDRRIRGGLQRPESRRLPHLHQGHPAGAHRGAERHLSRIAMRGYELAVAISAPVTHCSHPRNECGKLRH